MRELELNQRRDSMRSRVRRAVDARPFRGAVLGALAVVALAGFGIQAPPGGEILDDARAEILPGSSSGGTDPQTIPALEGVSAPEPTPSGLVAVAPESSDSPTSDPPDSTTSAVVTPLAVPSGDPRTVGAGGDPVTVAMVSGTGSIVLGFARTQDSAAPNLPTYVSALCDGTSVYSGAFNTTDAGAVAQEIPYSGDTCSIQVTVSQPSDRWSGTRSAVVVTRGETEELSGAPVTESAGWTSTPVASTESFSMDVPSGFEGMVTLKLTACSSDGGTSDETRTFACGGLVREGIGSQGTVTIRDGGQVLAGSAFAISGETHHDMLTLDVAGAPTGDLVIEVSSTGGSAVLVHGPGSGAVGTR